MTTDDQQIMQLVREDIDRGFRQLVARYMQPVYWHIRRLVVSHDDAQDATQETFLRIYRAIGQLRDVTSLRAWIFRIASREALRLIASRRQGGVSLDDDATEANRLEADPYVDYSDLEAVRLQRAILALPPKQQLCFNMRYYDEMGYDEIAQATDSTPSAVKTNYHIAKEKIMKYMNIENTTI